VVGEINLLVFCAQMQMIRNRRADTTSVEKIGPIMGRFHAGAVEGIDINDKLDLVIVVIPEMRDLNESACGPAGSIRLSPEVYRSGRPHTVRFRT